MDTPSQPVYRVYDPSTRRVIDTREVRFDESSAGRKDVFRTMTAVIEDESDAEDADGEAEREEEAGGEQHPDLHVVSSPVVKRGPGRPRGSLNKPKPPPTPHVMTLRSRRVQPAESGGHAFIARHAPEPQSVEEALSGDEAEDWRQAMDEEMTALHSNSTWRLEVMPAERSSIKSMWIFKKKFKSDGEIDRYKARLVAKGFSQRKGLDYNETYAPVVRYESVRMFLAISAGLKLDLRQFDVRTAFLHGDLDEVLYMDQPAEYEDGT